MKRIGSHRVPRKRTGREAGFTLTELVAGLLVASMLIIGLADVTRRYAMTMGRVKEAALEIRSAKLIQALMDDLERVDPGSLKVDSGRLSAEIGGEPVEATLASPARETSVLVWRSPRIERSIRVPGGARFEKSDAGIVMLRAGPGAPPVATVHPRRSAPYDCRFDTVARECR